MDSDDEYVPNTRARGLTNAEGAYRWEDEYHRSWDVVQEDSGGSLAPAVNGIIDTAKRRKIKPMAPVHRGIIRNLVLVLDASLAMSDTDMRPTRFYSMISSASVFVTDFFSQNPISQLAIVVLRDGLAVLTSKLDGNPQTHLDNLAQLRKSQVSGQASLQNGLELANVLLSQTPQYNTREVLLVFGALMSNDPKPISQTIHKLVENKVRVKIIGLAAEVAICRQICTQTNMGESNSYFIALNEQHFQTLLSDSLTPIPVLKERESAAKSTDSAEPATAVRMGFPKRQLHSMSASLCACHQTLTKQGFFCPQCKAKVCTLPMTCPVCALTLIMSTHLARGYHHLFPLQPFNQTQGYKNPCFGCSVSLANRSQFECPKCHNIFCVDCDVFFHENLHNCAGCEVQNTDVQG